MGWTAHGFLGLGIAAAVVGAGCDTPIYDDDDTAADDDTTVAGDDDTGDDDTGDDDTGDDDTGDDDTAYDDNDGDGWVASLDCDDGDPEVHPDALDWCGDGVDQDCSGTADDGALRIRPPVAVDEPFTYTVPAMGDFRGAGHTDLALSSYQMLLVLLHGDGAGGIDGSTLIGGPGTALSVLGGDFDQDGDPDLLVPLQSGCPLTRYTNNGAGSFGVGAAVPCAVDPSWGVVGDLDASGTADLVLVNPGTGTLQSLLGDGGFSFLQGPVQTPSIGAFEVQLADFDGDPYPDLAVTGTEGGVAAQLNDGLGQFTDATLVGTGWGLEFGLAADLDGDGLDDLLALLADGDALVSMNLGGGQFAAGERYGLPATGIYGTTVDLTADARPDLVVCSSTGLSILVNDGSGALTEAFFVDADLGGACRPIPVDLDADGVDELLVAAPSTLGYLVWSTCPD